MKNYFIEQKSKNWKYQSINDWIDKLFKLSKNEEQFIDNLNQLLIYSDQSKNFIDKADFLSDEQYINKLFNFTANPEYPLEFLNIVDKIKNYYKKMFLMLYPTDQWFFKIIKKSSFDEIKMIFDEIEAFTQYYWSSKPINFKLCDNS